ncbi:hypothetical protein NT6N_27240 [Oceaniferula spumae]|uniref:Ice-binding protein C-terminal domain-containing protein n=1 Tax=Oceaniferula spumae TaxID=2979115 RepID=A0AAT9FP58_9BACT
MKSTILYTLVASAVLGLNANAALVAFGGNGTVDGVGYTLSGTGTANGGGVSLSGNQSITVTFDSAVNLILLAAPSSGIHNDDNGELVTGVLTGGTWSLITDPDGELKVTNGIGTDTLTTTFDYITSGDRGPNNNDFISSNQDWSITSTGPVTQIVLSRNNIGGSSALALDVTAVPEPSSAGLLALGICGLAFRRSRA